MRSTKSEHPLNRFLLKSKRFRVNTKKNWQHCYVASIFDTLGKKAVIKLHIIFITEFATGNQAWVDLTSFLYVLLKKAGFKYLCFIDVFWGAIKSSIQGAKLFSMESWRILALKSSESVIALITTFRRANCLLTLEIFRRTIQSPKVFRCKGI